MESERTTPQQRIVLGVLMLGCVVLGWSLMASIPGNAFGRSVPPVPFVTIPALIVGLLTVTGSVALAIRMYGTREGLRMMGREAWPAFLFGAGGGAMLGFMLRTAFPGPTVILPMVTLFAGGAYFILWFARKAEPGGTAYSDGVIGVWKRYVAR